MNEVMIEYLFVPKEIVAKHLACVVPQIGSFVALESGVYEVSGVAYVVEPLSSPQRVCVSLIP